MVACTILFSWFRFFATFVLCKIVIKFYRKMFFVAYTMTKFQVAINLTPFDDKRKPQTIMFFFAALMPILLCKVLIPISFGH